MLQRFSLGWVLALCAGLVSANAQPTHPAPLHYALTDRHGLAGDSNWDQLSFDAPRARLFVTREDRIQVIDPASGKEIGEVRPGQGVHAVALAHELGRGFASNGRSNTITVFDLETFKNVTEVKVTGVDPDTILYLPETRRAYSFNAQSNDITVIDAESLDVTNTILLDGRPGSAVTDGRTIFVTLTDRSRIVALDADSGQVQRNVELAGCPEPAGLAIDTRHARLFSVCGNGKLLVLDAHTGNLLGEVNLAKEVDTIAFDRATGLLFGASPLGTVAVVREDESGHFVLTQTVVTQKSARTLAIDPRTHYVYLVAAEFGHAPPVSVALPHPHAPIISGSVSLLVLTP